MTATQNKEYIPELWNDVDTSVVSGLTMAQVSPFVTAEIAKGTAGLVKLDGTRPMTGNLDLASNDLTKVDVIHPTNPGGTITVNGSFEMKNYNLFGIQGLRARTGGTLKLLSNMEATGKTLDLQGGEIVNHRDISTASDNAVSNVKDTRHNYALIDTIYEKSQTNIFPVTGQVCTASSYYLPWGNGAKPENVFDNNQTTQWITGTAGQRSWVKVELPTPIQIWKVQFLPRQGHQQTTQLFTSYWFEASNDDVTYEKILESTDQINQMRSFELTITKPYKFFKFEGDGVQAMGLSEIQMFQATVLKASDVTNQITSGLAGVVQTTTPADLASGMVPYVALSPRGGLEITSTTNLLLDSNGKLFSAKGMIDIGGTLNMLNNNIQNLAEPQLDHEAVTKKYLDSLATTLVTQADFDVLIALPGLPIKADLEMAFFPTIKSLVFDLNNKVKSITDPFTNVQLTSPGTSYDPELKFDTVAKLYYLDFTSSELSKEKVSISALGGGAGNTTTFFFIANTRVQKMQNQFNWIKETAPSTYDTSQRLGVHLPWNTGIVYVDYAAVSGGRIYKNFGTRVSDIIGKKVLWTYVRKLGTAHLYLNGVLEHTVTNLTANFTPGDVGRFAIGNGNNINQFADMDFYGLFFYSKAMSDIEIKRMNMFLMNHFQI